MAVLTLTTDWGKSDYYVSALKGQLLQACPLLQVIDISHHIIPFNMQNAAFVASRAFRFFPSGSIHFIGVNAAAFADTPMVAAFADGHYFIWTDNDYLGFVAADFREVVQLNEQPAHSFAEIDLLPVVVSQLLNGAGLHSLGSPIALRTALPKSPVINDASIIAHVMHIDHYGNVITNLTRHIFETECKERGFIIYLGTRKYMIPRISQTYGDVASGYPVAFFNHCNLLEIACVHGNASQIYRLDADSTILIQFEKT